MATGAVRIEGLAELRSALNRCDKTLTAGVREALKDSAQIVAYETQRRAPVRTGRLVASVKSFTSGNRAGVRVTATRASRSYPAGYSYPKRLEFQRSGATAFVRPALDAKRPEVIRRFEYVIDDVGESFGGRF